TLLTGHNRWNWRDLRKKKPPMSRQRVDRYLTILRRFIKEFSENRYEIYYSMNGGGHKGWSQPVGYVRRRTEPGQPECPMKAARCPGGLYAGTCPRTWKECPLFDAMSGGL